MVVYLKSIVIIVCVHTQAFIIHGQCVNLCTGVLNWNSVAYCLGCSLILVALMLFL